MTPMKCMVSVLFKLRKQRKINTVKNTNKLILMEKKKFIFILKQLEDVEVRDRGFNKNIRYLFWILSRGSKDATYNSG